MKKFSTDKDINKMCNKILGTHHWIVARHKNHIILRHCQGEKLIVPTTPGDCNAFANFESHYRAILRKILICTGVIL